MGSSTSIEEMLSFETKVDAIVLAAGMSQRMGRENKLLLPFGQSTIIESTLFQIINVSLGDVVLVLGHDEMNVRENVANHFSQLKIVCNSSFKSGQVSSVKTGLKSLDQKRPFMICLADMPLITTLEYREVIVQFFNHNVIRPTILRPFSKKLGVGNPVLFDYSFKKALLDNDDLNSSQTVIQNHKNALMKWDTENSSFFTDIDNKAEYEAIRKKN